MSPKVSSAATSIDQSNSNVDNLLAFLEGRQDILVDRSIDIAKRNGYAPFTTTIRAAWVEAIHSVTESLGNYLRMEATGHAGPQATLDYKSDPRFSRMRLIARQHRSLGITLPMYIGLFKHFRNLYVAELDARSDGSLSSFRERVVSFFDETELSIAADWYNSDDNLRLREMQERSRAITLDKDRYFAIFESLRNPAFLLDKSQNLLNANQAAAELFLGDAQAGEIIYLRSMRQRKNSLQMVIGQIMEAVTEADRSVWLDTLSGTRCFDVRMRALHDAVENIPIGHVVLLNDVTDHRRATELAQRSERGMSRFLATMSHEIRTPLHSVLGATELLRTADFSASQNYLDLIENAGQTLLQTLNNVLDYSKLANEPPVPRPLFVDVYQAIEAFERVAAIGPDRATAKLVFDIEQGLPSHLQIDWAMTQQVLSNLVSNAIRADDGRGVTVSIKHLDTQPPALRFEVRDHGSGIPQEHAAALFRPFEKVSARDTGSGGAGLGLAIAHHLVEAMGGQIGYRNRTSGAMVWFEVPFQVGEMPSPGLTDLEKRKRPEATDVGNCLLIDDDPIGSTVTQKQLERLGIEVQRVGSVREATEAAEERRFDVFVVDYLLPDGDGPSLVREMRTRLPSRTRYIALTANVEALESCSDLSHLFDEILAKPVDQKTLSTALQAGIRDDLPTPGNGIPVNLEGLSSDTILAMTHAFEQAWEDFRNVLRNGDFSTEDLALKAHRLAGSTAILGLVELEVRLRELEKLLPEQRDDPQARALMASLDRDLETVEAWKNLSKLLGAS